MNKSDIADVLHQEIQAPWSFPDSTVCLRNWLDLIEPDVEKSSSQWITRMTSNVASLAMALSDYQTKKIDPVSFYLATILVAHCCHDDPDRGRVCSRVNLEGYSTKDSKLPTDIKGLFNLRFGGSGLA